MRVFKHLQVLRNKTAVGNAHLKHYLAEMASLCLLGHMALMRGLSKISTLGGSLAQELLDHPNCCLQEKECLHRWTVIRASTGMWVMGGHGHFYLLIILPTLTLLRLTKWGQEVSCSSLLM